MSITREIRSPINPGAVYAVKDHSAWIDDVRTSRTQPANRTLLVSVLDAIDLMTPADRLFLIAKLLGQEDAPFLRVDARRGVVASTSNVGEEATVITPECVSVHPRAEDALADRPEYLTVRSIPLV